MSLSADVPPFVSGPVFHGNAPSQYPLPQGGGYVATNPQVASAPPVPNSTSQGGYPHYMVNCYPFVSESVPQDGRQQGYPAQAPAPYTVPQSSHPYPPSPYDGYPQPQQQQMYQPLPPEQQGMTAPYQDQYYPTTYYPPVPQPPSYHQPLPQGFQGPLQHPQAAAYTTMPPQMPYQVPYSDPHGYHEPPPPQPSQGRHKHYSGSKHRSPRYTSDQSNVGCEAVTAELEAIKKRKTIVYTDAECQTDFPEHIANKTLSERPIEELVPSVKAVTKSTGNQTGPDNTKNGPDSSSDSCEEEEDGELKPQDSDSGYSGAGDVGGVKSYARVASQRYAPPQYQQQWPLPPAMSSQGGQGPVAAAAVSSWAKIASGGHQPAQPTHQAQYHHPSHHHHPHQHPPQVQPQHSQPTQHQPQYQPPQHQPPQHQPQYQPPQQQPAQMAPHSQPMSVPRPHPGQYPPMMHAQPGVIRVPPGEGKNPRQRRKATGTTAWLPPPPMISDANEYPDLPAAAAGGRGMVGYPAASYGGSQPPPSMPNYSNILQQKFKVSHEVDSDTSSEKDLPRNMLPSEEFRGNKMFRKKVKKSPQDYTGPMVHPSVPQETAKKSGKRSQRPLEIDLGLVLNNPQVPQQTFAQARPVAFGAGPHQFMGPPAALAGYQQQQPQGPLMGQQQVHWGTPMPMRGGLMPRALDGDGLGRKNIARNPLDSTGVVMKGKQRETPVKKKPSAMKKVIIAERQEKKRLRDMQEKKLSDNEEALSQSTVELDSSCYDSSFGLSQDPPSDRNSLSFGTHSDYSPVSQQDQLSLSPLSPGMGGSSQNGGLTPSQTEVLAMKQIHSNKWREYCKQIVTKEIDACCMTLLQTLVRFQERQYNRDGPIKAKSKRRIVMGLREVSKHLEKKKITCIIISTNLEKIQAKGGIDDVLNKITTTAEDQGVPVVYALCRSALGRAVNKIVPVSVVGVFSYNGAEDNFKELIALVDAARQEYQELLLEQKKLIEVKNVRNMKKQLGHRRNISNCSGISFSSVISNPISENDPEPEPEDDDDEVSGEAGEVGGDIEGDQQGVGEVEDGWSVNREGSTEKTNSETSACTVEEKQRKALVMQDTSCPEHIAEEEGGREEEGEEEEGDEGDSGKALAPEISVDERVNSWVAENQIQSLSMSDTV